jgi:CHASE3 domain sensor protein
MDITEAEDSKIIRMTAGLVVAVICLSIGFGLVLDRSLNRVSRSVTANLIVVENVDSMVDNLDRLNMNQRAFLSTGDDRYSEEIAESVMAISASLEALKQVSINGEPLRQRWVSRLSQRVDWALGSVEKTYEMKRLAGAEVAIVLLDNDITVEEAKMEALSLKRQATDGMFDRVESQEKMRSILQVLF